MVNVNRQKHTAKPSKMSQPMGEYVSECLERVRSHCEVEMGQGEVFLGFPRQFTALFYTKILNAVTT
jgi:hypothetical protein